ncbi:MAG: NUDIX domain-containing protein [Ktedonobacterales bacterium]
MNRQSDYFSLKTDQEGEAFIQSFDEVLTLAIDASDAVLFGVEPSPAFGGEPVLILPGGTVKHEEALGDTANRELQEEVGYRAESLIYLGEVRPWSKYLSVRTHLYLGRELQANKLPGDELTSVGIERIPLAELDSLVTSGRLRDARAIAAVYMARLALSPNHKC